MSIKFSSAGQHYYKSKKHSKGTSDDNKTTARKWISWGQELPLEQLFRSSIRHYLDRVYDDAIEQGGENPERRPNKARDHVRAVAAWARENDIIESLPLFPKPRPQRDVAGRRYLSKVGTERTLLCHVPDAPTTGMEAAALVWSVLAIRNHSSINHGLDTGTTWKTKTTHEPLLWRHVF